MYPDPKSRSARLYRRARRVLPDGGSRGTIRLDPYPIYVREGRGARIVDADGNEIIDFNNNYTSLIHGHANPAIEDAVRDQLSRGTAFSFGTEAEIKLAEMLVERVTSIERVRFTNSGSEAVMTALKAARALTGRPKIAKCEGAYHGSYDYAEVSLDSGEAGRNVAAPPSVAHARGTPQGVLDDVVVIPFNDTEAARRVLEGAADALAAVLFDPVSNRIGMIEPSAEFVAMLGEFCAATGALLVFDEVISFRMAYGGHQEWLGARPDLTVLGKIIGGGFPVGAVAGPAAAMAVFEAGGGRAALPHGGTFNANPITMVAGAACLAQLPQEAFERLNALGEKAREALRDAIAAAGVEAQVTGQGSLFRLHLTDRPLDGYRAALATPEEKARMTRLHRALLNEGVFLAPYGMGCLSTAMGEDEIARLADAVLSALRALAA